MSQTLKSSFHSLTYFCENKNNFYSCIFTGRFLTNTIERKFFVNHTLFFMIITSFAIKVLSIGKFYVIQKELPVSSSAIIIIIFFK